MSSVDRAFAAAIAAERLRSTRRMNRYRCVALTVFLALVATFRAASPEWIGPLTAVIVYWGVACVIWLVGALSARLALHTAFAVPLVDCPMVLFLMADNASALAAVGLPAESHAVRLGAGVFFLLIVLLASLALDVRQVYLAGAVATGCALALMSLGKPDVTWIVFLPAVIGVAVMVLAYAIERTHSLVRTVATEEMRRARLGRYFPPQVADQLDLDDDAMQAGESREVTLLFCDIRDFTALSEGLDGRAVVSLLNDFHSRMVAAIFEYSGTLDKFMGDGIMAYFGAPVTSPDHARRAVLCALRMHAKLTELNAVRRNDRQVPLRMGIGIHTGTVLLADVGAPGRRDYTAIGDAVNVAARLEQATKTNAAPILVSDAARTRAGDSILWHPAGAVTVRGKSESITCWTPAVT